MKACSQQHVAALRTTPCPWREGIGLRVFTMLVAAAIALSACGRSTPAPVVFGNGITSGATQKPSVPKPRARPTELARADDPKGLPRSATVTTVGGRETLYLVARRTGVALRDLIEVNGLIPPFRLREGQKLRIPKVQIHPVKRGDTLSGVARRFSVDMYTIATINRIEAPYTIRIGQNLRIPDRRRPEVASVDDSSRGQPAARSTAKVGTQETAKPPGPRSSSSRFAWPLRGRVISSYGAKPGGLHNDGINIAASAGAPVVAAESGTVAYAGNELRGFGNLLLLRHRGGWTTAYAHNEKLLVKRGDRVNRGDIIAHAGATGRVARPQLHFELRKGSDAVDPLSFLAPS